jgi:hypothetical protein
MQGEGVTKARAQSFQKKKVASSEYCHTDIGRRQKFQSSKNGVWQALSEQKPFDRYDDVERSQAREREREKRN